MLVALCFVVLSVWAVASSIANKVHFYTTGSWDALPWTIRGVLWNVHPLLVYILFIVCVVLLVRGWVAQKNREKNS